MLKTEIIGRIGNDAEIGEAGSGITVINFNVAVSEKWKNKGGEKQERTIWFRCSWWINNTSIAQYLTKGTQVYVSGVPNANAYQNQQGEIVVQEGINVRNLELLGGGADPGDKHQPKKETYEPQSDDIPGLDDLEF